MKEKEEDGVGFASLRMEVRMIVSHYCSQVAIRFVCMERMAIRQSKSILRKRNGWGERGRTMIRQRGEKSNIEMAMGELINALKSLNKDVLLIVIHELMKDGKLSFTELAQIHNDYLEELRDKQNERYSDLKTEIIKMWADHKKNMNDNLKKIMHDLVDKGEVNFTHERIDKR